MQEMRLSDHASFFRYLRMTPAKFDELLCKVGPLIVKQDTNYRKACSPGERLAVTLRHLANGDTQSSLSFSYRLGRNTICSIIKETTEAIWKTLQPEYLTCPDESGWQQIAHGFQERWNFPNCIGAIDGKHVTIQAPPNSGSHYFDYKHFFSMVLLAICDSRYCFTVVDIGSYGRGSDGSIYSTSRMATEDLKVPPACHVSGIGDMPHVIVGDAAFPLQRNLMRPYPGNELNHEQRIFNYR
ncbi:Uncharacterised protein at_DN1314 [Pycnogonum litorale]